MRRNLTKVGIVCFLAVGAAMTLLWTATIVWGMYEVALYVID